MSSYYLKIKGRRHKRFEALLIKLKISFRKVKENHDYLIIEVCEEEYEKIRKMKTTYEIAIVKRKGLAYILHLVKTKKVFIISFLCSYFVLLILTNLVFNIKIIETDKDLKERIMYDLKELGISKYHFKVNYQEKEEIRAKILEKEKDSLEWLEIEEIGTTYQVKLIKRIKNKKVEKLSERHIIAKKKGIITRIEADKGEIVVKKNQTVEKGDILISGFIKNKEEIKAKVAAVGKVYAEVWYQVKMKLPSYYQEEEKTGRSKSVLEILFLNKNIFLSEMFDYKNALEKQNIIYQNKLIPFVISFTKKEEIEVTSVNYSKDKENKEALKLAREKIKQKLGEDSNIISEKLLKKTTSAGTIDIDIFFKVEENITSYQAIDNVDINLENEKVKNEE